MPSPPPRSLDADLASQDWPRLSRELTKYAFFRLGKKKSLAAAEEIAQEAIARVLDPAYASWDRERYPDLLDCLGSIVNGLTSNERRKKSNRVRHVPLRDDERTHDDEELELDAQLPASPDENDPVPRDAVLLTEGRTAEDLLLHAASARERGAIEDLRARLAADAQALALLDRIQRGEKGARKHAEALGISVSEVYNVQRRITHHVRLIARSVAGGSEA